MAALGGLLFGFNTAVISGTTRALTETFHLSPWALGMTVSQHSGEQSLGPCSLAFPAINSAAVTVYVLWRSSTSFRRWDAPLPLTGCACSFPLHRRPRHWRFIGARSDVHRGDCARQMAGAVECFIVTRRLTYVRIFFQLFFCDLPAMAKLPDWSVHRGIIFDMFNISTAFKY